MATFSKKEALTYGWKTVKKNLWFFIGIMLTTAAVNYVPGILLTQIGEDFPAILFFLLYIIVWTAQVITQIGLLNISLKLVKKEKVKFSDLYRTYPLVIPFLLSSLLYGLAVMAGTILLIIPGIILAIRLHMYTYEIIHGAGPVEALKKSWDITKNNTINLILLGLILIVINIFGVLLLGVGLLLTMPTCMIASAYAYNKLKAN